MPVISREQFYEISNPEITCKVLLHPATDSCLKAVLNIVKHTFIGTSKFFLLIYILQSLLKWKKVNKNFIIKQIKAYLRSISYGICYAFTFHGSVCLVRRFTDKFYFYSIPLSGALGGLALFVESKENRILDTVIYVNLVAETLFRYIYWNQKTPRSPIAETLLFMTASSLLLYFLSEMKKQESVNLWFYYPKQSLANGSSKKCSHKGSCFQYFYQGFTSYFVMGYVLQIVKYSLSRFHGLIRNPTKLVKMLTSRNKIMFGIFLGSYVGIHRAATCFLRVNYSKELPIVTGFLAGSSYLLQPSLPILAIAVTTTLQLFLERAKEMGLALPRKEFLFSACSAFLLHNRFFVSDCCPQYVKTMLNTATNGIADELYGRALRLLLPS